MEKGKDLILFLRQDCLSTPTCNPAHLPPFEESLDWNYKLIQSQTCEDTKAFQFAEDLNGKTLRLEDSGALRNLNEGPVMDRRYPSAPVCAVGGIIFRGNQVLLVKRSQAPAEGKWSIPGGVVHLGETLERAVQRELFEELQVVVYPVRIGKVLERIFRDSTGKILFHYIIIDYVCEILSGVVQSGSDAAAASYFDIGCLESLDMTEGTAEIIREIFCGITNKTNGSELN